jgi:hypothetical protein
MTGKGQEVLCSQFSAAAMSIAVVSGLYLD